ncbi:LOW QUALITY PROTEIN: uncharacterized protein Dsimw501_GD18168 [Drosophila simulans]|nr:LOW QUALITY PROTEIN: uncharacterized protein Dsimw501_GD18168 [Drosophila simulans]
MAAQATQVQRFFNGYKQDMNRTLRDASKPWTKAFDSLEEKTGMDRVNIFVGSVLFCAFYLVFGWCAQLLCNIIGVLYPSYISIHGIESSTKQDDIRWLIYWVTFGIFTVIEFYPNLLTSMIPFYWLLKCTFLIWCMLPTERNGSTIIYHKLVRPYLLKLSEPVDRMSAGVPKDD